MILDRIVSRAPDTKVSRRSFLTTGAAVGGGLMLSLSLPFGRSDAAPSESFAPTRRVVMSTPAPGGKLTMTRTGRAG